MCCRFYPGPYRAAAFLPHVRSCACAAGHAAQRSTPLALVCEDAQVRGQRVVSQQAQVASCVLQRQAACTGFAAQHHQITRPVCLVPRLCVSPQPSLSSNSTVYEAHLVITCREWSSDQAAVLHYTYNRFRCAPSEACGAPLKQICVPMPNTWSILRRCACLAACPPCSPHLVDLCLPRSLCVQRPEVAPRPLRLRTHRGGCQALLHPAF